MRKNKFLLIFIISSMVCDFTALYIIVGFLRSVYHSQNVDGNYTQYMQLADTLKIKLDQIPILFWLSLGIAIGIIIMCLWIWVGFENDGKR